VANFIQISFPDLQPEQKDILIALLADAGFEGFEEVANQLEAFVIESKFNRSLLKEIAYQYKIGFIEKNIKPVIRNQV